MLPGNTMKGKELWKEKINFAIYFDGVCAFARRHNVQQTLTTVFWSFQEGPYTVRSVFTLVKEVLSLAILPSC